MGQSSRMRSTLTSQGAVQPQYRAIGGPEQPRRTGTAPRPAGERPPQGPHRALRRLPFALLAWRSHMPAHSHAHGLGHRPCEEFQPFAPSLRGHDAHARDVPPNPAKLGTSLALTGSALTAMTMAIMLTAYCRTRTTGAPAPVTKTSTGTNPAMTSVPPVHH
jgi:hypothetical protein